MLRFTRKAATIRSADPSTPRLIASGPARRTSTGSRASRATATTKPTSMRMASHSFARSDVEVRSPATQRTRPATDLDSRRLPLQVVELGTGNQPRQAVENQQADVLLDRPAFQGRFELRRIGVIGIDSAADFPRQKAGHHRDQEHRGQADPDPRPSRQEPGEYRRRHQSRQSEQEHGVEIESQAAPKPQRGRARPAAARQTGVQARRTPGCARPRSAGVPP